MRDFPIFTTEYGLSSLILKEIPYKKQAYIHIREVQPGHFREHLDECVSFCKMCGAEAAFAAGNEELEGCPLYTAVWEMKAIARPDPQYVKCLFPVTETTAAQWRQCYNERMYAVANSSTLESRDEKRITESTGTYFIHDNGELLGIGWLEDHKLLAMASVKPGAGKAVLHTLLTLAEGEQITLEVASANDRAIRLYEKFGFLRTAELSRWYCV